MSKLAICISLATLSVASIQASASNKLPKVGTTDWMPPSIVSCASDADVQAIGAAAQDPTGKGIFETFSRLMGEVTVDGAQECGRVEMNASLRVDVVTKFDGVLFNKSCQRFTGYDIAAFWKGLTLHIFFADDIDESTECPKEPDPT